MNCAGVGRRTEAAGKRRRGRPTSEVHVAFLRREDMNDAIKLAVTTVAAMAISGAAMAGGGLCGGKAHEASLPTETVSTDAGAPVTVADSGTVSTE